LYKFKLTYQATNLYYNKKNIYLIYRIEIMRNVIRKEVKEIDERKLYNRENLRVIRTYIYI